MSTAKNALHSAIAQLEFERNQIDAALAKLREVLSELTGVELVPVPPTGDHGKRIAIPNLPKRKGGRPRKIKTAAKKLGRPRKEVQSVKLPPVAVTPPVGKRGHKKTTVPTELPRRERRYTCAGCEELKADVPAHVESRDLGIGHREVKKWCGDCWDEELDRREGV